MRTIIHVHDLMQNGYRYALTEPEGEHFSEDFNPELSPEDMLRLGVFGGRYMTDCTREYPRSWFRNAKLCPARHDPALNCFGVLAGLPLAVWRQKGWLHPDDPRGWFQWYCRYFLGRRSPDDVRQIARWNAMTRHLSQLRKHSNTAERGSRPRQRQTLLQWAYDVRTL